MAKWYSPEMKEFHITNKTDTYRVYQWYYKGRTLNWNPKDLKWGGIGIAPYEDIPERYRLEILECKSGARKRMRTMVKMIDRYQGEGKIGFRIIARGLSREDALYMEAALRPPNWTHKTDRRIWNEVAGG